MILDEAIAHAEEQASKLGNCSCGDEHRQLASWLRELKLRREANPGYPNLRKLSKGNENESTLRVS